MTSLRVLSWLVIAAMVLSIAYAAVNGSFGDEASTIGGLAWGKVTLIDLYAGLFIFGAWVAFRESQPGAVAVWWIALATLGNLAAGVYLVLALRRADEVDQLLKGSRARGAA